MRIISQDGRTDIPYENFVFSITKDNCIVAIRDTVARPTEVAKGVVAIYSTDEKAKKAMEMLHRAYIGMPVIAVKDVEMDVKMVSDAIRNGFVQPMPLNEPKIECDIFKFPRDEEVEVQDEQ